MLAAIAIFLEDCGFNVFLVGPSNASVDALARETSKLDPDNDYVRVRPANVESMAMETPYPADNRKPKCKSKPENENSKMHNKLVGTLNAHKKRLSRKAEGDPEHSVLAHGRRKCRRAIDKKENFMINVAKWCPIQ